MQRRIQSSFSIRKRLPVRLFGSNIYETIRIPINPILAFIIMIAEWFLAPDEEQDRKRNEP